MADFINEFMKTYGQEVSKNMASTYGVDQGTVQKLIPQLAPLILGGLKRQKDDRGGDARIDTWRFFPQKIRDCTNTRL